MSTIVVGVDGSHGSVDALRFAIEEARAHHSGVKVVTAWHVPPAAYGTGWSVPVDINGFKAAAQDVLDKSLAEVGAADCGVPVTAELGQGQAADVLCHEAEGAELLVVGSRGLGGFRGLLLGSVSQQVSHHAPCPVVVVPDGKKHSDE